MNQINAPIATEIPIPVSVCGCAPSFHQPYHPASFHSIKRKDNFRLIEHSQQTLHGSRRVARSRFNVFPQDAPSVLYGANERILIATIHRGTPLRYKETQSQAARWLRTG